MEQFSIQEIMDRTLGYYIMCALLMGLLAGAAMVYSIKSKSTKADSMGVISVCLVVVIALYMFFTVMPFVEDYIGNDVVVVRCEYYNTQSESSTSIGGIYGITISTLQGEVHLSTAPLSSPDDFPRGKYDAIAYYADKSKTLLYIEIIDVID